MREIEDLKDKLTEKIKTFRIINYITSFFVALTISSFIGAIGIGLAAVVIFFLALGGTEGLQYYYLPGGIIGFFALLGIFGFILIYYLYNKIYKSSINKEKYSFYKIKLAYDMLKINRELKENMTDWQTNIL